jgi:hypothetical protein
MTSITRRVPAGLFLVVVFILIVLPVCPVFAQSPAPPPAEIEEKELKTPEPIEKTEEAREQEKIRKYEQTQYELDEMGMTLEERKMRRVRPEKP